jgi:predicted DNA-binding transcriptional regulator YafY
LRHAVVAQRKVRLDYVDAQGRISQRVVRPLGCFYWGAVWTLAAWCETRAAFRSFRIDRVRQVSVLDEGYTNETGKTLADFLRAVAA